MEYEIIIAISKDAPRQGKSALIGMRFMAFNVPVKKKIPRSNY
jgi:hypothetical protein